MTLRSGKVLEPVPSTSRAHDSSRDKEKLDTEALCKKEREEKEIIDTFRKGEISIPLVDVIRQIPRYAKFLKELRTSKRKLLGNEKVNVGKNVSAILQRKIPPKCKNQCMLFIYCKIGSVGIKKAMCDSGAPINVMPLKETGVIIQLADRSVMHLEGVLEDVLVKVNELIFPIDFYIIDVEVDISANLSDTLLRRSFLSTAQIKIGVRSRILTMELHGEVKRKTWYEFLNTIKSNWVSPVHVVPEKIA
ncbi:hypothetical protein V6Z12_D09G035300 [Gossypium hirsutum]